MGGWNQHFSGYGKGLCDNFADRRGRAREKMEWGREGVSIGNHKTASMKARKKVSKRREKKC